MGVSKMGDQITLAAVLNLLLALATLLGARAQQCGSQANGALCDGGLCCSQWGYCGSNDRYCGTGCQSQCNGGGGDGGGGGGETPSSSGGDGVGSIVTQAIFDEMLKHRNDDVCPGRNFYNYDVFIAVANSFNGFGTTGDLDTRKREIAAFLAQTSQETTGGSPSAPDAYSWGYCFIEEQGNPGDYCTPSADGLCAQWPCAQGKKYYGRGPIQISTNCNYGQAGQAIHEDLLNNPDLVAKDATISFKTAIWFWMTPQPPKPSCHSVMVGQWSPSADDVAAGRQPGYGVVTNIINGGVECGHVSDRAANRIGFYKRYCDILGVSYGSNLDCDSQRPFA